MPSPSFGSVSCGLGSQRAHWRLIFSFAAARLVVRRNAVYSVGGFIFLERGVKGESKREKFRRAV